MSLPHPRLAKHHLRTSHVNGWCVSEYTPFDTPGPAAIIDWCHRHGYAVSRVSHDHVRGVMVIRWTKEGG